MKWTSLYVKAELRVIWQYNLNANNVQINKKVKKENRELTSENVWKHFGELHVQDINLAFSLVLSNIYSNPIESEYSAV